MPDDLPMTARRLSPLAWVLVGALVVRVLVVVGAWAAAGSPVVFVAEDTHTYTAPARDLAAHGTFTVRGERPELVRTPGYPLLMAVGFAAGRPAEVILALQVLLSVATVAGVHAVARALFGDRRIAVAAAALYAVEPLSVAYTGLLLTETLYTALLAWALWLLVRYAKSARTLDLLAATVLLVAAVYVRPAGYFLPFCVAAFVAARAVWTRRFGGIAQAAGAALLAVALIAPWHLRNRRYDYPGFSAITALSVYYYNAGALLAARNGLPVEVQQRNMGWGQGGDYLANHPEQRDWSPGRRFAYMEREGKRIVRQNLPRYAVIHAKGVVGAVVGTGGGEFQRLFGHPPGEARFLDRLRQGRPHPRDLLHLPPAVVLVVLYGLAAYGLLDRKRWSAALVLAICVAAYHVAIAGGVGNTRFRHPAMPMVCAAAGVGIVRWIDRRRVRSIDLTDRIATPSIAAAG